MNYKSLIFKFKYSSYIFFSCIGLYILNYDIFKHTDAPFKLFLDLWYVKLFIVSLGGYCLKQGFELATYIASRLPSDHSAIDLLPNMKKMVDANDVVLTNIADFILRTSKEIENLQEQLKSLPKKDHGKEILSTVNRIVPFSAGIKDARKNPRLRFIIDSFIGIITTMSAGHKEQEKILEALAKLKKNDESAGYLEDIKAA